VIDTGMSTRAILIERQYHLETLIVLICY
jgi:hypothetical protein